MDTLILKNGKILLVNGKCFTKGFPQMIMYSSAPIGTVSAFAMQTPPVD